MFHGFRDVIREHGLTEPTVGLEKNFFDTALFEVFKGHILPKAKVVPAGPVLSRLRMIKEAAEIECMKAAGRVADAGMVAAGEAIGAGTRKTTLRVRPNTPCAGRER